MKRRITFDLLARLKSPRNGYSRAALAQMGVSWPPKRGWRKKLLREAKENEGQDKLNGNQAESFDHVEVASIRFGLMTPDQRVKWLENRRETFCFLCGQAHDFCKCVTEAPEADNDTGD